MSGKYFWYSLMIGALALWFISIYVGYYLFPENTIMKWAPFLFIVVLHTAEIPFVIKLLREKKVKPSIIVMKTFLFGFTWWLPFKKGILLK